MDGFDTMTMSYMAAPPMSLSNVASTDALSMPLLPLDGLDHTSNFDADTYIGYVIVFPVIQVS
jgi:hypothetical protein